MSDDQSVQAIVHEVVTDGKHGPYAVTSHDKLGSITFALTDDVWSEDDNPELGEIVCLSKLRKKQAGWRSMEARRLRPSIQQ